MDCLKRTGDGGRPICGMRSAGSKQKEGFNEEWELRREGRTGAGLFSAFPGRVSWSRLFPLFSVFQRGEA